MKVGRVDVGGSMMKGRVADVWCGDAIREGGGFGQSLTRASKPAIRGGRRTPPPNMSSAGMRRLPSGGSGFMRLACDDAAPAVAVDRLGMRGGTPMPSGRVMRLGALWVRVPQRPNPLQLFHLLSSCELALHSQNLLSGCQRHRRSEPIRCADKTEDCCFF